jgi:hypothetical protein
VAPKFSILISLRFGLQTWENIPFDRAINTVERFLKAEQNEFVVFVTQINTDEGLAHFFSDLFSEAEAPSEDDWSAPRITLSRALNAYNSGHDQLAMRTFSDGVRGFNFAHAKFYKYRETLTKTADRIQTTLVITSMVAGATFSAAAGLVWAGVAAGATASAGLTLAEEIAGTVSKHYVGKRTDFEYAEIADIVIATGASFVSSLISGKLTEKFASALARRWIVKAYNLGVPGGYLTFKEIVYWAEQQGVALPFKITSSKEFVIGLVTSFGADRLLDQVKEFAQRNKGKAMTVAEFIEGLAMRLVIVSPGSSQKR